MSDNSSTSAIIDKRFPIGALDRTKKDDPDHLAKCEEWIANFPQKLRAVVSSMTEAQINTPYREGGWTVRQVVHHCADSHINAYTRFKLALTEETPTIKTYEEAKWAELEDARTLPLEPSLNILDGLHARWTYTLRQLSPEEYATVKIFHPEQKREMSLAEVLVIYGWHCEHHLAHINLVAEGA